MNHSTGAHPVHDPLQPSGNALEEHLQTEPHQDEGTPIQGRNSSNNGPGGGFDPLRHCPASQRSRYAAAARNANQPLKAIKLKCLDCSGWDYQEAKRCTVRTCALWRLNHRVFRREAV